MYVTIPQMSGKKEESSGSDGSSSGSSSSSSEDENDTVEKRVKKYSKADRRAARLTLGGKQTGTWRKMSWEERLKLLQQMATASGKKHKHSHFSNVIIERKSDDLEGSGSTDQGGGWGEFGDDELMDSKGRRERSSSLVVVGSRGGWGEFGDDELMDSKGGRERSSSLVVVIPKGTTSNTK